MLTFRRRVPTPQPSPERSDEPAGFRFPSISDSSDSADSENIEIGREPSLELISSTPTNANEVIFLSQSRVQHKRNINNKSPIDLTIRDSPVPIGNTGGTSKHPIALEVEDANLDSSEDEGPEIITRCRKPFNAPSNPAPPAQSVMAECVVDKPITLNNRQTSCIVQEPSPPEEEPEKPSGNTEEPGQDVEKPSEELETFARNLQKALDEKLAERSGTTLPAPGRRQSQTEGDGHKSHIEHVSDYMVNRIRQPSIDDYSEVIEADSIRWAEESSDEPSSDGQEEDEHEYPETPSEFCESVDNETESDHDDSQDDLPDYTSELASASDENADDGFGVQSPGRYQVPPAAMGSSDPFEHSTSISFETAVPSQTSFVADSLNAGPSMPRPPSPSDAALARSSTTVLPVGQGSFYAPQSDQDAFPPQQYSPQRPSQNAYATPQIHPWNDKSVMDHIYQRVRPWDYEYSAYNNHSRNNSYTDGPFARTCGRHSQDSTTRYSSFRPFQDHYYSGEQLVDIEIGHAGSSSPSEASEYSDGGTSEQPKQRPSKAPISDIVNNAPLASATSSPHGPLKRKADEMSAEMGSVKANDPMEPSVLRCSGDFEDDPMLPNAQPREPFVPTAYTVPESMDKVESALSEIKSMSTQLEANLSSMIRPPIAAKTTDERIEPPRKRIKLTRPSKGFMRTFASGCLAGAVTVIGAAAAFVATIPASVQDEALRTF